MNRRHFLAALAALPAAASTSATQLDRSHLSAITDEIGKTPAEAIDFAHRYGLRWVEVRGLPMGVPNAGRNYCDLPEEEVKEAAREIADAGLKVSFLNTGLLKFGLPGAAPLSRRKQTPEAAARSAERDQQRFDRRLDDLRNALRTAHLFGVDRMRVFTFSRVEEPLSVLPRVTDLIGEMAEIAAREKVLLLLENEASCNAGTSAELAAFVKPLPASTVGFNWDPQNALPLHETPYPDGYRELDIRRMRNAQVKAYGVLGPNKVDWPGILAQMNRDGYREQLGLETHVYDGTLIEKANAAMTEILKMVA